MSSIASTKNTTNSNESRKIRIGKMNNVNRYFITLTPMLDSDTLQANRRNGALTSMQLPQMLSIIGLQASVTKQKT